MPCNKCGHTVSKTARYCEQCGADLSHPSRNLHIATKYKSIDTVRQLIDEGVDLDARDDDGNTALLYATGSKGGKPASSEGIARLLIDAGADVRVAGPDGTTPLHNVAAWGYIELARLLIKKGADIEATTLDGYTPLLMSDGTSDEVENLLIQEGANVHVKSASGTTRLHNPFMTVERYEKLIDLGLDIDAMSESGTPLHEAADFNKLDYARLLIEKGADIDARDSYGNTPLLNAAFMSKPGSFGSKTKINGKPVAGPERFETGQLLIEQGANLKAKDRHGWTALHFTAFFNAVEFTRILIENGADINAKDKFGSTPLEKTVDDKHFETAQILIDHGAKTTIGFLRREKIDLSWMDKSTK